MFKSFSSTLQLIIIFSVLTSLTVNCKSQEVKSQNSISKNKTEELIYEKQKRQLEASKLELEIRKLDLELRNNNRDLATEQGKINLLFSFGVPVAAAFTATVTIMTGILSWAYNRRKELNEKKEQRLENEEERFYETIKRLGEEELKRGNAVSELFLYTESKYERFHKRLISNILINLKIHHSKKPESKDASNTESKSSIILINDRYVIKDTQDIIADPIIEIFSSLLVKLYPLLRDKLFIKNKANKKIKEESLLELVADYYDATGIHLEGTYLVGADFKYAWMRSSFFNSAILKNANFYRANLERCDFSSKANFENTNLSRANLIKAKFKNANLIRTNFSYSDCTKAEFNEANIVRSKFNKTNLYKCNFKGTRFEEVDFIGTTFSENNNLEEAEFIEVTMENVSGLTNSQIKTLETLGIKFKINLERLYQFYRLAIFKGSEIFAYSLLWVMIFSSRKTDLPVFPPTSS